MTRIAVLSDIHANYQALEAVLADCERRQVDTYWYLGDIVVYGPQPNECITRLRKLLSDEKFSVRGNNDHVVIRRLQKGSVAVADFNLIDNNARDLSRERQRYVLATDASTAWTVKTLTENNRAWLIDLPNSGITPLNHEDVWLVHASPCDPVGEDGSYLHDIEAAEEAWLSLPEGKKLCFFGHTHLRTVFRRADLERKYMVTERIAVTDEPLPVDGRLLLVNPGSVGQPRDGVAAAAYAIYDTERKHIEFYRVAYPITETIQALEAIRGELEEVIPDMQQWRDLKITDVKTAAETVIAMLAQRLREAQ